MNTSAEGITTRTNAVSLGELTFTAGIVGEVATNLDLINAAGEAKYYIAGTGTDTVDVSNPNKSATLIAKVTATLAQASTGVTLEDALKSFFSTKKVTLAIAVDGAGSTGLQVDEYNGSRSGASAYAAATFATLDLGLSDFNTSTGLTDTTAAKYKFEYWCLENGRSDDSSSPIGGTINVNVGTANA